ncbi:MAG: serpin family protein [Lachnospiraceae bacterium]|nr:serpin family protein [Lachnospiraceae bacterium]
MKRRYVSLILTLAIALSGCGKEQALVEHEEDVVELTQEENAESESTDIMEEIKSKTIKIKAPEKRSTQEVISINDVTMDNRVIDSFSDSSVSMFAETVKKTDKNENVLIAPTSLIMALGMTENGADGETLKQMEEAVNGGLNIEEADQVLRALYLKMNDSQGVEWNNANSIWFKDDGVLELKDDFVSKATYYFGAELFKASFNGGTLKDINKWVSDQTKERIPEILDSISPDACTYLINAISFDAKWAKEYEASAIHENEVFTNADGSRSEVTMLSSKEDRYFEYGDALGFIKPYEGQEYSFVGILPNEGTDIAEYISWMDENSKGFADAVRDSDYADVFVTMPQFTVEYGTEMSNVLKEMGMTDAFDPGKADFSNMIETANGADYPIAIERVIHKTFINVDRNGTQAAAATVVEMRCYAAAPMEKQLFINLDRPFIYAIVDNETGLPMFIGCVNTLNK